MAALATLLALSFPQAGDDDSGAAPHATLEVVPVQATVGDLLTATLSIDLPAGTRLDPPELGPRLGAFAVDDAGWTGPEEREEGIRWTWTGTLVSYRTGEIEVPSVSVTVEGEDGKQMTAETMPLTVTIDSVLPPRQEGEEGAEIADLKPPASLAPDYGALMTAAAILALLLIGTAVLWWVHRRYAARLAAVAAPEDPFHRTPPHEWFYGALQDLLQKRLAEQGEFERFFVELSWILKRYLGGRFRVEMLELTSAEVPHRLSQAGAPENAIRAVSNLLDRCDGVKFAREPADSAACRSAVEDAYRIVDETKPLDAAMPDATKGAA